MFLALGLACYGAVLLFAGDFYRIFTPDDLELAAFAYEKSRAYFGGFFLAGFNILMISFWQSIGATWKALCVSLLRSVILPPLFIMALPVLLGREAVWFCQSAAEILTACWVTAAMLRKRKEST